jgi:predicted anti-sigma-YlaC factor YlaD
MKHEKIRELLSPYLDNELSEADNISIGNHLNECSSCRKELN